MPLAALLAVGVGWQAFAQLRAFRAAWPPPDTWTQMLREFEPRLRALRQVREGAPQAALVLEPGIVPFGSTGQQVEVIRYLAAPIRLVPPGLGADLPVLALFSDDASLENWMRASGTQVRMKLGEGAAVLTPLPAAEAVPALFEERSLFEKGEQP